MYIPSYEKRHTGKYAANLFVKITAMILTDGSGIGWEKHKQPILIFPKSFSSMWCMIKTLFGFALPCPSPARLFTHLRMICFPRVRILAETAAASAKHNLPTLAKTFTKQWMHFSTAFHWRVATLTLHYLFLQRRLRNTVLSDSATPSYLNASNFLTGKDNIMFNPIFGMLSSRAIQNIPDMLGYF